MSCGVDVFFHFLECFFKFGPVDFQLPELIRVGVGLFQFFLDRFQILKEVVHDPEGVEITHSLGYVGSQFLDEGRDVFQIVLLPFPVPCL